MAGYREQYERMRRWYRRFERLNRGQTHQMSSDDYLDEIYAFFMNCYHLKDWIKNDSKIDPDVRRKVEDYINANRPLSLCADICNSLKHLRLTSSRSGENPTFGSREISLTLGSTSPTISLNCEVVTSRSPIDAFQLATDCVNAWDNFLTDNRLL